MLTSKRRNYEFCDWEKCEKRQICLGFVYIGMGKNGIHVLIMNVNNRYVNVWFVKMFEIRIESGEINGVSIIYILWFLSPIAI